MINVTRTYMSDTAKYIDDTREGDDFRQCFVVVKELHSILETKI